MEFRAFRADDVQEDEGKLSGLAAPFGKVTQIGSEKWGFREEIAKGAFAKTIQERDVVMLDNHDHHRPLARKSAGTLTLRESGKGLEFDATPADTSYGRDVLTSVRAKNYGGMSFGFEVIKDDWYNDKGEAVTRYDGTHRILREVKLIEISPVTFPAYDSTSVSARDMVSAAREARAGAKPAGKTKNTNPKKPYGNVAYADPKNGKYPIDTKKHVMAAWAYINQPKNESEYPLNGVTVAMVKAKIKAAAKKFGITIGKTREAELAAEWVELAERYDVNEKLIEHRVKTGTKKRIPQIVTELNAAEAAFASAKNIPDDLTDAVNLVASANTHAKHIRDIENLGDTYFSKKDKKADRSNPKPESSTSGTDAVNALSADDWLRQKRHSLRAAQMRHEATSTSN